MTTASFTVEVSAETPHAFAELSGDWNPLHTDRAYAAGTAFKEPILHGAFSAGLVSRLAGMHLPGTSCLLHSMSLRFLAPIRPPARLVVSGEQEGRQGDSGRVRVTIRDADAGMRYVDASYEFSLHARTAGDEPARAPTRRASSDAPVTIVTGANGALGRAVLAALGEDGLGVSRHAADGLLHASSFDELPPLLGGRRLRAIVHCGWPSPDNTRLVALDDPGTAIEHHVTRPLVQVLSLARLLDVHGTDDAMLVLVGSTAADPGRHNYRAPLYSLAKGMIPHLARILALELGGTGRRCAALTYDVIEGGMNARLSPAARLAHIDRSPTGRLPSPADAARQVIWLLENSSYLVSGATIAVSGAAIP